MFRKKQNHLLSLTGLVLGLLCYGCQDPDDAAAAINLDMGQVVTREISYKASHGHYAQTPKEMNLQTASTVSINPADNDSTYLLTAEQDGRRCIINYPDPDAAGAISASDSLNILLSHVFCNSLDGTKSADIKSAPMALKLLASGEMLYYLETNKYTANPGNMPNVLIPAYTTHFHLANNGQSVRLQVTTPRGADCSLLLSGRGGMGEAVCQ